MDSKYLYSNNNGYLPLFDTAKDNANAWLYVDINGLDQLAGETLKVTPTIELDGHTYELTNGTVSYLVA